MSIIKRNKNFKKNIIKLLYNLIDNLLYYKKKHELYLYIFFTLK